jgi:hypothetical protein
MVATAGVVTTLGLAWPSAAQAQGPNPGSAPDVSDAEVRALRDELDGLRQEFAAIRRRP